MSGKLRDGHAAAPHDDISIDFVLLNASDGTIKRTIPAVLSRWSSSMLSLRDCFAFSELTDEEVQVIAEHEHIPEIVAAELGNGLVHSEDGVLMIKAYMLDCIEHARRNGHFDRADALYAVYRRFDAAHPASAMH
jgi:hypothetical protein